ncbi:hypothetical protein [Ekhidna sp.]
MLDSIYSGKHIQLTAIDHLNESSLQSDIYTNTSPLGSNAQLLRASTYSCDSKEKETGIWIKYLNKFYLYRNHELYQRNDGLDEQVKAKSLGKKLKLALKSLNILEKRSAYAENIIQTLQKSENRFVISIVNSIDSYTLFPLPNDKLGVLNNNAYAFQVIDSRSHMVDYAPFDRIGSGAEIRWQSKQGMLALAHELAHAYDANFGLLDDRLMLVGGIAMSAREVRALFHENMIRKELNRDFRIEVTSGHALIADGKPYTYPIPDIASH